jgi:hypothetical protein
MGYLQVVFVRIPPVSFPLPPLQRPTHDRVRPLYLNRIGIALADSIDELLREEAITPQLAQTIMVQVCPVSNSVVIGVWR